MASVRVGTIKSRSLAHVLLELDLYLVDDPDGTYKEVFTAALGYARGIQEPTEITLFDTGSKSDLDAARSGFVGAATVVHLLPEITLSVMVFNSATDSWEVYDPPYVVKGLYD